MADAVKQSSPLVLTPRWDTIRRAEVTPQGDGTLIQRNRTYSQVIVAAPFGANLPLENLDPAAAKIRDAERSRAAQQREIQQVTSQFADHPLGLQTALAAVEAKVHPPASETSLTEELRPSIASVTVKDSDHRGAKIGLCDGWTLSQENTKPGQQWDSTKNQYVEGTPFKRYTFNTDGSSLTIEANNLSKLTIERDAKYCNPPVAPQPAKAANK